MIRYFDIIEFDVEEGLAERLGFGSFLRLGKGIVVTESLKNLRDKKAIMSTVSDGLLLRAIKESEVIGILYKSAPIPKKVLEELHNEGKVLFLNVSEIVCSDKSVRMKKIYYTKKLVKLAIHSKVKIVLATFARDRHELLSSMQVLEIAKMFGATHEQSLKMLSNLDGIYDS